MSSRNHINLRIEEVDNETITKVKVFCLQNDREREEYEEIINDDSKTILEKDGPTLDKLGRAILILH